MIVNISTLYCTIPVWMTLTFSEGHSCLRRLQHWSSCKFLCSFGCNLVCFHGLLVCWSSYQSCFFRTISVKGRVLYLDAFRRNAFDVDICSDTYELSFSKLGIMLDITKLYQFWWPWPSLKVTGLWKSQNMCNHSVVMWHELAQLLS